MRQTKRFSKSLNKLRNLHNVSEITNTIKDGNVPFPEDRMKMSSGIELEFRYDVEFVTDGDIDIWLTLHGRNVSFKYPDAEKYALHNISFHLLPGQLCVRSLPLFYCYTILFML